MSDQEGAAAVATRFWLQGLIADLTAIRDDIDAALSTLQRDQAGEGEAPGRCWNALQSLNAMLCTLSMDDGEPLPPGPEAAK